MSKEKITRISARQYHEKTSYDRSGMRGHGLDWANRPRVFKTYPGRQTIPLPDVAGSKEQNLSDLIHSHPEKASSEPLDFSSLGRILSLSHAVTARARHGGEDFFYRNVASAGALFPFELYVGTLDVDGLEDGLYHQSLSLHGLTLLRKGSIVESFQPGFDRFRLSLPLIVFFVTVIYYRSAWKYRDRAYRYHLLDSGHLLENLLLGIASEQRSVTLTYDFDDEKINAFLGIDTQKEACLAVALVQGDRKWADDGTASFFEPADQSLAEASQVSLYEDDLSLIKDIHAASKGGASEASLAHPGSDSGSKKKASYVSHAGHWPEVMSYQQAVFSRRSKRNFIQRDVSAAAFNGLLDLLCWEFTLGSQDASWMARSGLSVGFLCDHVEGHSPGFYRLRPGDGSLDFVSGGSMTHAMAHICLDQAWLANCAVHVVFLCDFSTMEKLWGPRGYRYAMLSAGRLGQRLYLGSSSMGLGCCGIGAFYDEEASHLLGLSDDMKMLYIVALGPVKR